FGGTNMIMENLGGPYANAEQKYDLCKSAKFCKRELEEMESGFFDEAPPQDGHRKNILFPEHNLVGLGLSLFSVDGQADANSLGLTCCQEFVDEYGKFSSLPLSASNGDILTLEGRLKNGLKLYCVDVRREDIPKPIALPDLRKNYYHSYSAPNDTFIGFSPEQASALEGGGFAMKMPIANNWKSGLYHFIVWVESGNGKPFIASQQLVAIGLTKPVKPLRASK
ncbi:MAG: hypothetical protein K2X81_13720, partial [Candidatus Obscuribacterales bacterium]|nr:hypothetical protein [Candidatus Obscuribacterales bacterium]